MPTMFSVAWHLSEVEGIWQFGFFGYGVLNQKHWVTFLSCTVRHAMCNMSKNIAAPSIWCIVFFHKLLNTVEDISYLDWSQAVSKYFCSFNNVLIVGTFCAPVKPFAWNHPWEIALSTVEPGKLSFEQGNSWITSCWYIYLYVSPYNQPSLAVTLAPGDCWKLAHGGGAALQLFYVKVLAKPVLAGRAQSCCRSLSHASFFCTCFVCSGLKLWLWAIFQTPLIPALHSQRKGLWSQVSYFHKRGEHDYAFCFFTANKYCIWTTSQVQHSIP